LIESLIEGFVRVDCNCLDILSISFVSSLRANFEISSLCPFASFIKDFGLGVIFLSKFFLLLIH